MNRRKSGSAALTDKKRYVQIDAFYNGSTGSLMRRAHERLLEEGWDSYIFWGRGRATVSEHEVRFASPLSVYLHVLLARLFDRAGFYSKRDTKRLIKRLEKIGPDVVHLHGLQGYYVNLPLLFQWLANQECKVNITLHDCWLMTGHCPYFTLYGCNRWKSGCHDCPLCREYPKSLLLDQSERNHREKIELLGLLDSDRVTVICPSEWMRKLALQSHLGRFRCVVEHNEIDGSVFKARKSDFRSKHGLDGRVLVLGVAAIWTKRKGFDDFLALRSMLSADEYQIMLIGLDEKTIAHLPEGIVGMARTESQSELAEAYSAADIFVNPTYEDNYPTVNLEAESCGTPVVCYDTGGCRETLGLANSRLVDTGDIEALAEQIREVCKSKDGRMRQ